VKSLPSSSTSSSSARADWQRLLAPLGVAAGLLMLVELVLQIAGFQPLLWLGIHEDEYSVLFTKVAKAQKAGRKVCAFIGDSRVEWSVSPETVQDVLEGAGVRDTEVYNLAYPGANVRYLLDGLMQTGFFPDCLVVGYSHLSFYWSTVPFKPPERVDRWSAATTTMSHFLLDHSILAQPRFWETIALRRGPLTDARTWIGHRSISPRGQAHISYRIPEQHALAEQRKWYGIMYSTPMPPERVRQINTSFYAQIDKVRSHGTRVLMLRMPVAGWVRTLERENEVYAFEQLARDINAPGVDLNLLPGSEGFKYFDGLHVAPPSDAKVSEYLGRQLLSLRCVTALH